MKALCDLYYTLLHYHPLICQIYYVIFIIYVINDNDYYI